LKEVPQARIGSKGVCRKKCPLDKPWRREERGTTVLGRNEEAMLVILRGDRKNTKREEVLTKGTKNKGREA